jgi:PAS domain S-box-containing protein
MINFYDVTGETLLVNRGVERVLGWSKAELQEIDRLAECYPDPKEHQRILDFMREASGEWQDFKTRTKDGRILDTSWANIRLSDGTAIGIGSDISERKRAEAALQESEARYRCVVDHVKEVIFQIDSEARYRCVVDHVKEVIFQIDAEGLWTFLNPAWTEIMEFTVEESIGTNFLNYIHPEDRQRNLELFQPLIDRQKDYCRHEIRYITKAGQVRWIEVFARLTLDANNNVIGTSGTLNDITDRKQAEEQLRWQEALLRLMTNASPLAFYVVDNRNVVF